MKHSEALELVAIFSMAYPGAKFTTDSGKIYAEFLADLDAEVAAVAVKRLVARCKWIPTIAEIRAEALLVVAGPPRSALEAWGEVGRLCERVGQDGRPKFADAIAARCVEAMGWRYLCKSCNEVSDRSKFCELYAELQAQERAERVAGALGASKPTRELPAAADGIERARMQG